MTRFVISGYDQTSSVTCMYVTETEMVISGTALGDCKSYHVVQDYA